ncbi:MAG: DUF4411 family protein [Bacteroidia bacterium]
MKVVIDTSSLMALVRYYLPFDKDDSLKNFIQKKVESKEIIVLDKVHEESKYVAKGIVLKQLDFIKEKSNTVKTADLLPYPKFFNIVDNQLCNQTIKKLKGINETEYEKQKNEYLDSADGKLILYCLSEKKQNTLLDDKTILVTEETSSENDSKLFKKLPECCKILELENCTLPTLLENHYNIKLSNYLK